MSRIAEHHTQLQEIHGIRAGFRALYTLVRLTAIGLFGLLLAAGAPARAQWNQVWGGNFPGANGTTYDHTHWWNNVQPNAPWGDGTIQSTSDSTSNVYIDGNGNLVIAMTYAPGAPSPYTSARLTSRSALGPYGKLDTKIQNPSAAGMGAAFWALGADAYPAATAPGTANPNANGGIVWPACGELDMMELQSQNSAHNGSTVHGSTAPAGGSGGGDVYVSSTIDLAPPANFDNGFHQFTTEWAPYHLLFFLDGSATPYGDIDLADTGAADHWELNQPVNVILSSGIGGNGGTPGTTGFPSNMTVQYVNYSQWAAGPPAPVTGLSITAPFSNAANLSWTASTTSGVTYDIYASTVPNTPTTIATLVAQNISATSYQHTGLQPNQTYYYTVVAANFGGESAAAKQTVTTAAPGNSTGMQLSAGGYAVGTYTNSSFVVGGNTNAHLHVPVDTSAVTTPAPQQVYDTERWGAAAWTITGLNPGGKYTVRLHFVETTHTGAGQRNFNLSLNSYTVLTNFDIYQVAGAKNKAITEQFSTEANALGLIELQTQYGNSGVADLNPTVSGIEIIPGATGALVGATPGTVTDLAINSGGGIAGGFVADEEFNGGEPGAAVPSTTLISTAGVTNPAPQAVYQTSRIAPFTYTLTGLQANATYSLDLHFAETFFTAANQRVFDVAVNGTTFLHNFDIFAQAGANHALVQSTTAVADQYGQVIVQLLQGAQNTPVISGLEAKLLSSGGTATAPVITTQPQSASVVLGSAATFTVVASGTAPLTYQWYAGGAPVANATSSTYTTPATVAANNGEQIYVVVTGGSGLQVTSNMASLTVTSGGGTGTGGTDVAAINAGSTAAMGTFAADATCTAGASYNPGQTITIPASIAGMAAPEKVYESACQGTSTYTIGGLVSGNTYTVVLHFAELYFSAAGSRQFNVAINGTPIPALQNFDIFAAANNARFTAVVKTVPNISAVNGQIVISLTNGVKDQAMINGIEIQGAGVTANPPPPVSSAIDAGSPTAVAGYAADTVCNAGAIYNPGQTIAIPGTLSGIAAPEKVYESACQGPVTYTLTGFAPNSLHTVNLHFAELYFTAASSRLFNVSINGVPVPGLQNFDIVAAANNARFTAVVKSIPNVSANGGNIVVSLTSGAKDQPMINGISIQ